MRGTTQQKRRIVTYDFGENFIENLTSFLLKEGRPSPSDFSRIACVFGGKRPALFLRRSLSRALRKPFYPPVVFSIDEFIEYIIADESRRRVNAIDACYLIYTVMKQEAPSLIKGEGSFNEFLPWASEVVSFIDLLDLEDIPARKLLSVEKSAAIGYEIPASINTLLGHIVNIRRNYHRLLYEKNLYSRGFLYLRASEMIKQKSCSEFDRIVFCNPFYLHATEMRIINEVYEKGKGICIFQGRKEEWSVFGRVAEHLHIPLESHQKTLSSPHVHFYQGFDMHSQAALVRHILSTYSLKEGSTVIVVPRPEAVIPLLGEIASQVDEVNVSMGYPLQRTALYSLFVALLNAQETKHNLSYYTKDYLSLLRHPLIKNLTIAQNPAITRVLVHKIEEILGGSEETSIGGSLFLTLRQIEEEEIIFLRTAQTLHNMEIEVSNQECKEVLKKLHVLFFESWEGIENFSDFAGRLDDLLRVLVAQSKVLSFPFNIKVIEKLHRMREELKNALFSRERFFSRHIWEIFNQKLQEEMVPFLGHPLKGIQILGLFETRALNFDNVIVIDANESVLPKLKVHQPLIPREVMLALGLDHLEKEEEIQRYHFMRLLSSAKDVFLIYEETREKEKSRFIEALLWERQKKARKIEVAAIPKTSFRVGVTPSAVQIKKTPQMVAFLRQQTYSASRLNTYLSCPAQFYYQYVLGLEERDDLLDDPQASHIGTFIHQLLEETFKKFKGRKPAITAQFRRYFFGVMEEKFEREIAHRMKSDSFLLKRIIRKRLERFLEREQKRDVAKVLCLEETEYGTITLNGETIAFQYTVDRIDELSSGSITIIDYKTGGANLTPKKHDALLGMQMSRSSIKENIRSFQLPLYYYFISEKFPGREVNAELYNLRTLERKRFIPEGEKEKGKQIMHVCMEALSFLFSELFKSNAVFVPDRDERRCQLCEFRALCPA